MLDTQARMSKECHAHNLEARAIVDEQNKAWQLKLERDIMERKDEFEFRRELERKLERELEAWRLERQFQLEMETISYA